MVCAVLHFTPDIMSCVGYFTLLFLSMSDRADQPDLLSSVDEVFQGMSSSWRNLIKSPVCEVRRSLKKLFVPQANPKIQGTRRQPFFCCQPFFQIGFYLPNMMLVIMSPRLLTFQRKTNWVAKSQQVHLVLSKMGLDKRDKLGLLGTDLVTLGGRRR